MFVHFVTWSLCFCLSPLIYFFSITPCACKFSGQTLCWFKKYVFVKQSNLICSVELTWSSLSLHIYFSVPETRVVLYQCELNLIETLFQFGLFFLLEKLFYVVVVDQTLPLCLLWQDAELNIKLDLEIKHINKLLCLYFNQFLMPTFCNCHVLFVIKTIFKT